MVVSQPFFEIDPFEKYNDNIKLAKGTPRNVAFGCPLFIELSHIISIINSPF
jgi:hypothetical protein